jgi:DNA-binding LytR/AlgR family response regulator
METIRALLVDDEALAIRRLSRSLEKVAGIEVVGATTSARQAVDLIGSERPDMLFLDISMPGLDGFELIERIAPAAAPAIIFVTAYDAHAVQAFDVAAADYLMKPFAQARLEEAVGRGRLWLRARATAPAWLDSLWVHRHRAFVRVPVGEIDWIEAHGDYARVHSHGTTALARTTLTALEGKLDPATFIRVHRSAICRKAAIRGLKRGRGGVAGQWRGGPGRAPVRAGAESALESLVGLGIHERIQSGGEPDFPRPAAA